jgi:hypothetical protein
MGKLKYTTQEVQGLLDKMDDYPQAFDAETITNAVNIDGHTIKRTATGSLYVDKAVVGGGGSTQTMTEDITSDVTNGYYTISSPSVGATTSATRVTDGAWRCLACSVSAGEKFYITGTGGGGARLYCAVDNNNVVQAVANSGEVQNEYELSIQKDGMLYCSFYADADYKVAKAISASSQMDLIKTNQANIADHEERLSDNEREISELDERITDLENNGGGSGGGGTQESITEDITSTLVNGYYAYSSPTVGTVTSASKTTDGGWRCLARSVYAGEKYYITGTGGGGARLYCLVDADNVVQAIAGSGESQIEYELRVRNDGMLYCSFDKNQTYKIVRKYTASEAVNENGATWKNGSYEFGRGIDCNYTAPEISRYSLPAVGGIVSAVYGWYDELVAAYPQYVVKEDCDAAMASKGISKPSAISSLPMYMYKFIPPKAPNHSAFNTATSEVNMIRALILTGTHPEYTAVWDCYNAMKLVCEKWSEDKNLEELRWNAEIYIIPCYNLYGVNNSTRTNENGVDLNRNAPTEYWTPQGSYGDSTYSGATAGSEYSTKVMMHYLETLKPQVFIDHHNTNVGSGTSEGDGKNMIYTHCALQIGVDIAGVLISQMTRKWKKRYSDTFPSVESEPNVLYGFTSNDSIVGSIGKYGAEQGALGSTYESNFGILYKNGVYSTSNRQTNTALVSTCATEGFINYLVRCLKAYSEQIGVNTNE